MKHSQNLGQNGQIPLFGKICRNLPLFLKYIGIYHNLRTRVLLRIETMAVADLEFSIFKCHLELELHKLKFYVDIILHTMSLTLTLSLSLSIPEIWLSLSTSFSISFANPKILPIPLTVILILSCHLLPFLTSQSSLSSETYTKRISPIQPLRVQIKPS